MWPSSRKINARIKTWVLRFACTDGARIALGLRMGFAMHGNTLVATVRRSTREIMGPDHIRASRAIMSWRLLNARMSGAQAERHSSRHPRAAALSAPGSVIISTTGTDARRGYDDDATCDTAGDRLMMVNTNPQLPLYSKLTDNAATEVATCPTRWPATARRQRSRRAPEMSAFTRRGAPSYSITNMVRTRRASSSLVGSTSPMPISPAGCREGHDPPARRSSDRKLTCRRR